MEQCRWWSWRHRRLDGEPVDVEITLKAVEVEGRTMILGALRDITEQKKAEEELRRQHDLMGAVLEGSEESGTPAIVSDIPGNRDLIDHEKTGWRVAVGDAAGFARRANTVFEEPARAAELAAAARARVENHFSVKQMVDRYAELYRQLVS